jgi:hypothetical protein
VAPGRKQRRDRGERGSTSHGLQNHAHRLPSELDVVLLREVFRPFGSRFALPERGEEDSGLLAGLEETEGRGEEEEARAQ